MVFENPFLSISGQKERLSNVAGVLAQSLNPFSKVKPVANVENKTLKAGLEFIAANPYTTAGLVTGGVSIAKAPIQTLTKVGSLIKTYPKTAIATTVITGAAVKSSTIREKVIGTASKVTPESLLSFGGKIGEYVEKVPQEDITLKEKAKELIPIVKDAGIVAGITGLVIGGTALIPSAMEKIGEIRKERKEEKAQEELINAIEEMKPENVQTLPTPINTTPTLPQSSEVIPPSESPSGIPILEKDISRKRIKYKKKKEVQPIRINNRVDVYNRNINKLVYA